MFECRPATSTRTWESGHTFKRSPPCFLELWTLTTSEEAPRHQPSHMLRDRSTFGVHITEFQTNVSRTNQHGWLRTMSVPPPRLGLPITTMALNREPIKHSTFIMSMHPETEREKNCINFHSLFKWHLSRTRFARPVRSKWSSQINQQ